MITTVTIKVKGKGTPKILSKKNILIEGDKLEAKELGSFISIIEAYIQADDGAKKIGRYK